MVKLSSLYFNEIPSPSLHKMMIGDHRRQILAIQIPFSAEPTSPFSTGDPDSPVDAFSCDHFRMFEFKVRNCSRGRSHDWTDCPYAHPGEKARRRDPRRYYYSATSCPEFRKGVCNKGDNCEFAHGVFECWLHPARYRTQPCKDGVFCRRQVCFFAHSPDQLRVLPKHCVKEHGSGDSNFISPPLSPPSNSPPISPGTLRVVGTCNTESEIIAAVRNMQLGKMIVGRGAMQSNSFGFGSGSTRSVGYVRPGCFSPTIAGMDVWEARFNEEPVMERVESGRDLRAQLYAKLNKENSLDRVAPGPNPDVGWVSELVT